MFNIKLVERSARWVGQMLRMFGLGEGESSEIGWGQERSAQDNFDVSVQSSSIVAVLNRPFPPVEGRGPDALYSHTFFFP